MVKGFDWVAEYVVKLVVGGDDGEGEPWRVRHDGDPCIDVDVAVVVAVVVVAVVVVVVVVVVKEVESPKGPSSSRWGEGS